MSNFKNWPQKMPIAQKITFFFTGIFVVAMMMSTISIIVNASIYTNQVTRGDLSEGLQTVVDYIQLGNEITETKIKEITTNDRIDVLIIDMQNNRVLAGYEALGLPSLFAVSAISEEESSLGDDDNTVAFREAIKLKLGREGRDFIRLEKAVEYNSNAYLVNVFRRQSFEQKFVQTISLFILFINTIGFVIAYTAGRFITKRLLNPVERLRQTAEHISSEDLSRRLEICGPDDEIKELAITFNDMIDRLEKAFIKQKQFVSDASHELRTPISVIQGYANLISRWGKSDPAILDEAIESIKLETNHMSVLIKKLLFLAKDEQNKRHVIKHPISLTEVVEEVVKDAAITDTKHEFSHFVTEDGCVYADWDLIKQLLWIFIENSIKYTAEQGKITVTVYLDNDRGCIAVKDTGIGIPQEDIPNIFDRFYRVDKSRNKEIEGTGLGLSIAMWIIKQHDAEIEVRSTVGEGTEMIIKFNLYKE